MLVVTLVHGCQEHYSCYSFFFFFFFLQAAMQIIFMVSVQMFCYVQADKF